MDETRIIEILQVQAELFTNALSLLRELADDVKDMRKRLTKLEASQALGLEEMDTTPEASNVVTPAKENMISKTPAQDRLKRFKRCWKIFLEKIYNKISVFL